MLKSHSDVLNRKIRVVHLTYSLDMGGCETLQIEFARLANRSRFDLRFVSIDSLGRSAEIIEQLGWPVDSLRKPLGFHPKYILRLAKQLCRWKPDVLHTHDNGPLIYGSAAGRLAGVPAIVHTRHHGKLPWIEPSKLNTAKWASRLVNRMVCVSKDSLDEGIKEGISRDRLMTIWNGIDTSRFEFDPSHLGQVGPVVSVACLRPDKNTESLIRATAEIVKQEPGFRLMLAGDGLPDRVETLKQLARDLKLENSVIFLGNVANVPALLAEASLMVLPSTTEGISIALLEAMACGLPVIATDVGGNPEVVVDGVTGLLVPPNDDQAMIKALLLLYRDAELRRKMGAAGRVKVVRDFEIRRMVADYESLYLDHLPNQDAARLKPTAGLATRLGRCETSN